MAAVALLLRLATPKPYASGATWQSNPVQKLTKCWLQHRQHHRSQHRRSAGGAPQRHCCPVAPASLAAMRCRSSVTCSCCLGSRPSAGAAAVGLWPDWGADWTERPIGPVNVCLARPGMGAPGEEGAVGFDPGRAGPPARQPRKPWLAPPSWDGVSPSNRGSCDE